MVTIVVLFIRDLVLGFPCCSHRIVRQYHVVQSFCILLLSPIHDAPPTSISVARFSGNPVLRALAKNARAPKGVKPSRVLSLLPVVIDPHSTSPYCCVWRKFRWRRIIQAESVSSLNFFNKAPQYQQSFVRASPTALCRNASFFVSERNFLVVSNQPAWKKSSKPQSSLWFIVHHPWCATRRVSRSAVCPSYVTHTT